MHWDRLLILNLQNNRIRFISITHSPENFHSRLSAKKKTYEYHIDLRNPHTVFLRRYSYLPDLKEVENINIENIKRAAKQLIGTHDFSSFTSDKTPDKNMIRTIEDIDIILTDEQILTFRFTGNGFLYNMVRILSGTLLECGLGNKNITYKDIPFILESKNRSLAGPTLPPEGLFLAEVFY